MLRHSVKIPTADMLRRELQARAVDAREEIKQELSTVRRISIALDAWTSPNKKAFLAIQAYYITDDWKYRFALIGFEELSGSHTGENLAKVVRDCLISVDIHARLFAVTTDNAGNNGTLTRHLEEMIREIHREEDITDNVWDYEVMHIPCLAHVVQLSVNCFLKAIKVTAENDSLDKCVDEEDVEAVRRLDKSFNRTLTMVC